MEAHVPEQAAVVRPLVLPKVPLGQGEHEMKPGAAHVPGTHCAGEDVPLLAHEKPAGQGTHAEELLAPAEALNVPAAQG
jgi:hypothetical protein